MPPTHTHTPSNYNEKNQHTTKCYQEWAATTTSLNADESENWYNLFGREFDIAQ